MKQVECREEVDLDYFHDVVRPAARPVVLRGLVADWPAVAAGREGPSALVSYLKHFAGDQPVAFAEAGPANQGRFHYADDLTGLNFDRREATMGSLLDRLMAQQGQPAPPSIAAQGVVIGAALPGFERDNRMSLLPPDVRPRAWIGNAAKVATHHDPLENIACVIAGRRRFTLFPPDQLPNLYMGPFHPTPAGTPISMVHVTAPDLQRYPRFAKALAAAEVADLEPGDAIYIPYQWYHHVESFGALTMLVNYWWNEASTGPSPWDAMLHGMMALRGLPADQRAAWRAAFDHFVFLENGDPAAHLPAHAKGILGRSTAADIEEMRRTLLRHLQEGR